MSAPERVTTKVAHPIPELDAASGRVVGQCPTCGAEVLLNLYFIAGRGYLFSRECRGALADPATCDHRRPL